VLQEQRALFSSPGRGNRITSAPPPRWSRASCCRVALERLRRSTSRRLAPSHLRPRTPRGHRQQLLDRLRHPARLPGDLAVGPQGGGEQQDRVAPRNRPRHPLRPWQRPGRRRPPRCGARAGPPPERLALLVKGRPGAAHHLGGAARVDPADRQLRWVHVDRGRDFQAPPGGPGTGGTGPGRSPCNNFACVTNRNKSLQIVTRTPHLSCELDEGYKRFMAQSGEFSEFLFSLSPSLLKACELIT
jgi:hypothetical protein